MPEDDPFHLQRFVTAQDRDGTHERALRELRDGIKKSHWMWFIFPQIAGLGRTEISRTYAVAGLPEARAYLAHPVLGPRLRACAEAMIGLRTADPVAVLGGTDAMKLRSSMTLFVHAAPDEAVFRDVLDRFYGGEEDPATIEKIAG